MKITNDGFELGRGEVFALGAATPGRLVRCLAGALWITQAGDFRDHVLLAGDALEVDGRRRIVVQALRTSRFHLVRRDGRAA